ncbi:MAG: hypothetical protein JWM06_2405 [Actinomycetia bacterium]|nr:hypothetical protein [Actinomycetes bacterium]
MRRPRLVAVAFLTPLVVAAPGFAHPQTTNAPAILTIKVTITDKSITVRPNAAPRGTSATFILTNRGTKTQKWVLGHTTRGAGKTSGFASVLAPDQQKNVVMFLDYRGSLPYSASQLGGGKTVLTGSFKIR